MRLLAVLALVPLAMAGLTGLWPNGNISRTSPELSNFSSARIAHPVQTVRFVREPSDDFALRWPLAAETAETLEQTPPVPVQIRNAEFVSLIPINYQHPTHANDINGLARKSKGDLCARHGLRRVYVNRWRWRCLK